MVRSRSGHGAVKDAATAGTTLGDIWEQQGIRRLILASLTAVVAFAVVVGPSQEPVENSVVTTQHLKYPDGWQAPKPYIRIVPQPE